MKKLVFTCFALSVMIGCKTKEKQEENNVQTDSRIEAVEEKTPSVELGCYIYDANGNLIILEITDINDSVLGNLSYALKEKDANTGTFAGILKDSVLLGSYTFISEGTESTREVAFLVKGNQLIEGFGELDETGTAFKDKSTLSFSSSMPLSKTDCEP